MSQLEENLAVRPTAAVLPAVSLIEEKYRGTYSKYITPAVSRCKALSDRAFRLYSVLTSYYIGDPPGPEAGYGHIKDRYGPRQKQLTEDMNCCWTTLKKYLDELVEFELLIIERHRDGNVYRFPKPEEVLTKRGLIKFVAVGGNSEKGSSAAGARAVKVNPPLRSNGKPFHDTNERPNPMRPVPARSANSNPSSVQEPQHVEVSESQHVEVSESQHVGIALNKRDLRESQENHHPLPPPTEKLDKEPPTPGKVVAVASSEISSETLAPKTGARADHEKSGLSEKARLEVEEICRRLAFDWAAARRLVTQAEANGRPAGSGYLTGLMDYVLSNSRINSPQGAFASLVKRNEERNSLGVGAAAAAAPAPAPAGPPKHPYINLPQAKSLAWAVQLAQRDLREAWSDEGRKKAQEKLDYYAQVEEYYRRQQQQGQSSISQVGENNAALTTTAG